MKPGTELFGEKIVEILNFHTNYLKILLKKF